MNDRIVAPASLAYPLAISTRRADNRRTHLIESAETWIYTRWRPPNRSELVVRTVCNRTLSHAWAVADADRFPMCDDCALADFSGPCVYRLLDVSGEALYIGATNNLWQRLASHRSSDFWPLMADFTFERYPTLEEAVHVEAELIAVHQPPFNNDRTGRVRRIRQRASVAA